MASARTQVCKVCASKFQFSTKRVTCSAACWDRKREEQRTETLARRRAHVKKCPECRRVFSREEVLEAEDQFEQRICCSNDCSRKHQKKEKVARNSVVYQGVRLPIEDVCKLEQQSVAKIKLLMKKGELPGARWAEPKLRARYGRPPSDPKPPRDEIIKVRMTEEQKDVIEAYARWRGMNNGAELLMMVVHQEMRLKPKP